MSMREWIAKRLQDGLRAAVVDVHDDSDDHAGHPFLPGAGAGHYRAKVISEQFEGKSPVVRHRMVYAALGDAMKADIHALVIEALTPQEAKSK